MGYSESLWQAQVFSYWPPGARRHGQEVQVTVQGEISMWGRHGSIDWTTSGPSRIAFVPLLWGVENGVENCAARSLFQVRICHGPCTWDKIDSIQRFVLGFSHNMDLVAFIFLRSKHLGFFFYFLSNSRLEDIDFFFKVTLSRLCSLYLLWVLKTLQYKHDWHYNTCWSRIGKIRTVCVYKKEKKPVQTKLQTFLPLGCIKHGS